MKKVLTLTLCLLAVLLVFAACAEEHQHTFETQWRHDETNHWHDANCEHTDMVSEKGAHVFEGGDTCTVCSYTKDHVHTFDNTWTFNETSHWYASTCGHQDVKDKADHVDANKDGKCEVCEFQFCEHTYATEWSGDHNNHWYAVTCGCEVEVKGLVAHTDADEDFICDECQRPMHTGYEDDGMCDECGEKVLDMYSMSFTVVGEGVSVLDMEGNPLKDASYVEQSVVQFKVIVAKNWRLEAIENAEMGEPEYGEDGSATYAVSIKLTADGMNVNVKAVKTSAVEVVKEDSFKAEVPGGDRYYYLLSFTAEKAGEYVVISYNEKFNVGPEDWVYGGWDNNPFFGKFTYSFKAEAGETVKVKFFNTGYDKLTEDVKYAILQVDQKFELPYLKGEGYTIPTRVNLTVTVTLPTKGLYVFTTQAGNLVWLADQNDTSDGDISTKIVEATKDNDQVELTFRINDSSRSTYEFDWELVALPVVGNLNLGENTVRVEIESGKYTGYTFTADKTGTYNFTLATNVAAYMWTEMSWDPGKYHMAGFSGEYELMKGQTITIYTLTDPYAQEDITAAFDGTVNIEFMGYQPALDGNGNPTLLPDAEWEFEAAENGQYTFVVPEGVEISVNGGSTWATNKVQIILKKGEKVTLMVKNTEGALVTVQKVLFKHNVGVGEGTLSFVPNQSYTVTLTGTLNPAKVKSYILTWTDTKLTIKLGDKVIVSGEAFDYDPEKDVLVAVYTGEAEKVAVTLIDNFDAPPEGTILQPGENKVIVSSSTFGKEMELLAAAGQYIIKPDWGEENAKLLVNGVEVTMPYAVTVGEGETVKLLFATVNGKSDTLNIMVQSKAEYMSEVLQNLLVGKYIAKHPRMGMVMYELSFEYSIMSRATVLTIVDYNTKAMGKLDGTYKIEVKNGTVVLTNTADGVVVTGFSIGLNDSEQLTMTVDGMTYVLEADNGSDQPGGTELVVGNNAINTPAGFDGVDVTFTAPENGTYIIGAAEGETNIFLTYDHTSYSLSDLPIVITMTAGQTITINVSTDDMNADVIDISVTKQGSQGDHKHTFSSEWKSNADGHWHEATCEHTDVKGDEGWHMDDSGDGLCDTCGYKMYDVFEVTVVLPEGAYIDSMGDKITSGTIVLNANWPYLSVYLPNYYKLDSIRVDSQAATLDGEAYKDFWTGMFTVPVVVSGSGELKITAEKNSVNTEYVVKDQQVVIKVPAGEWSVTHTVEVEITTPGKYFVTASVSDASCSFAFDYYGTKVWVIDAKEAGKYTFTVYCDWWFSDPPAELTLTYSVLKEPAPMKIEMSGGLNIPNGISVDLKVTLPEPGMYSITNSSNVSWYLNGKNMGTSFVYEATAETLELTLTVTGNGDLMWDIAVVTDYFDNIQVGNNELYIEGMKGVNFTAPLTGAYRLNATGCTIHLWQKQEDGSYKMVNKGESLIVTLVKDEQYKIYCQLGEDAFFAELYVESLGNMPEAESGVYKPVVGILNSWIATKDGTFKLVVTDGQITVDGKTWAEEIEIVAANGEIVYYMVKANSESANAVALEIQEVKFEGTLELGEGTLNLRPNKEYIITLTGAVGVGSFYFKQYNYQILWTDPNIKAYSYGWSGIGEEFESGYTVNGSGTVYIVIVYSGEAAADITFTVKENNPISATFQKGDNAQELVAGKTYDVTLPMAPYDSKGNMNWILTWDNADVVVMYNQVPVQSGVKFTGYSASLVINFNGAADATVNFNVVCVEPEEEEAGSDYELILGENVITDEAALFGDVNITFTATMAGTYKFTANDDMMVNNVPKREIEVTLAAGESFTFSLYSWSLSVTVTVEKV